MSKKLEELDLKEVAERTRIEVEFFEALVARDFDALSRFNVKGFLKILKREYDVDLSDLGDEFAGFLGIKPESKPDEIDSSKKVINSNLDHYERKGSNAWLWVIVVVVVIALLFFVWQQGFLKVFLSDESAQNQSEIALANTNAAENSLNGSANSNGFGDSAGAFGSQNSALQSVQEAEQLSNAVGAAGLQNAAQGAENSQNSALNSALNSAGQVAQNSAQNPTPQGSQGAQNSQNSVNLNANNAAQNLATAQNSQNLAAQSPTTAQNSQISLQSALNAANAEQALVTPSVRVWVGFIDLESRAKTSMITDKDFSINLAKDQLLLVGGADLHIKKPDGTEQNFAGGGSKRFLVQGGEIKEISIREFRSYNGGMDY